VVVNSQHSTIVPLSFEKGGETNVNWTLEAEIAATTTELAFDAISTVLECKMRSSGGGGDSWSTWNCLQNCLRSVRVMIMHNISISFMSF
jgi:hypothetical protein